MKEKKKSKVFDVMMNISNDTTQPSQDSAEKQSNKYWEVNDIHNDVLELVMVNGEGNVKMYIIPNDSFEYNGDDKQYYSVVTIAYNKELRKTVSNYSVCDEDTIKRNHGIDITDMLFENNNLVTISDIQAQIAANYVATNINIIKAACKDKEALFNITNEILLTIGIQQETGDEQ